MAIQIPNTAVPNDFYRQALALDLRGKREYTEAILSAMGSIKKAHFSEIKALLKLSDEALELADRYALEEKKLRYVVTLPPEYHAEIVRQIIDFNLTSKQVKQLCEGDGLDTTNQNDEGERLPASALKMAKIAQTSSMTSAQDLAQAMIRQEGDVNMARARLQALRKLLSEAERYLTES